MRKIFDKQNLLITMGFLMALALQANDAVSELSSARDLGNGVIELNFKIASTNEEGALVKRQISAQDDDGLLSLAAINLFLTQDYSEKLSRMGQEGASGDFHGNNQLDPRSVRKAMDEWEKIKGDNVANFSSLKPAILSSLSRLSGYQKALIAKIKGQLIQAERMGDVSRYHALLADLAAAEQENKDAVSVYDSLKDKEELSVEDLGHSVGALLVKFGETHRYNTSESGRELGALALFDKDYRNPLGYLMWSRPAQMGDRYRGFNHRVLDLSLARGSLSLSQEVWTNLERSSAVAEGTAEEGGHRNLPSLENDLIIPGQP